MKIALLSILLLVSAVGTAASFDETSGEFNDTARSRKIPYKIYYPSPLEKQYPVIVVSHGLGSSREGNEILGKHLAGHGFIVMHVQHAGSDENIYRGARNRQDIQSSLRRSLLQPANAVNRFLDLPFVVAQLPKLNESDERFKGHLNLQAIGVAGHSYGAVSAMVAAGERIGERYTSFKIPSVRAGLALSPSPPRDGRDLARVYANVAIPIFHMTGTDDVSLVDARDVDAGERVIPYRTLNVPNQYLLVLNKADHVTFSGRRINTREETKFDKKHMMAVLDGALAFFQAYLMDNKEAETWLRTEYKKKLGDGDVYEFK